MILRLIDKDTVTNKYFTQINQLDKKYDNLLFIGYDFSVKLLEIYFLSYFILNL